ncbi:oxidoreductase [Natronococcus sp.]|uniref:oxidoreductase n=1 Tax=Natronococcus sp. TaxID=35747 RepID=UPI003A4DF32A
MERRKFLIGAGGTAIGASALVGSGAFSFVRAERDLDVEVVNDKDAYLGLEATSEYASGTGDGQLELDWASDNGEGGKGLNENADSRFDDVFKIINQGTNDARISFHDTEGEVGYDSPGATWYYSSDGGWEDNEVNDDPVLEPGDSIYIHVIFRLTEYDEDDLPEHLGIVAEEP